MAAKMGAEKGARFSCDQCKVEFRFESNLTTHMKLYGPEHDIDDVNGTKKKRSSKENSKDPDPNETAVPGETLARYNQRKPEPDETGPQSCYT